MKGSQLRHTWSPVFYTERGSQSAWEKGRQASVAERSILLWET